MSGKLNTLTVCRASAGTGKTYTLASRYIALLMDDEGDFLYRNILAVTFTNKATAEMKQRILSFLYIIAEGDEDSDKRRELVDNILRYVRFSKTRYAAAHGGEELRLKARRIYHNILEDYDNMKIVTIDSFFQTLITGMSQIVGLGASFNVVLDMSHVIATAIDEIMTTHIHDNKDTESRLTEYVEERLELEKKWDVRKDLLEVVKEIYTEAVQKEDVDALLDVKVLSAYKKSITSRYYAKIQPMRHLYDKVARCVANDEIEKGKLYYAFIRRIKNSLDNKVDTKDAFSGLTDKTVKSLQSDKFLAKFKDASRGEEVQHTLQEINDMCDDLRRAYLSYKITTQYLNDLMLMNSVKDRIKVNLDEANSILLARTAYVLHQSLKPGDADFVLEKAGIRFKHIMIDEFQDTSTLQWEVFKQLVNEVLSSGGTTLIVGDVKQSIYRWRNGDYSIMQNLGSDTPLLGVYYDENSEALTRNYRSQANVMKFNLSLFGKLIADDGAASMYRSIYQEGTEGYSDSRLNDFHRYGDMHNGYVQCRVYPYLPKSNKDATEGQLTLKRKFVNKQIATDMFGEIGQLIDMGASPSDVLILIRNRAEIVPIIEAFKNSELVARGITVCSNDSFLLEKSLSVQLIINALKYLFLGDMIAKEFLSLHKAKTDRLAECNRRMPLYELVEHVVTMLFGDDDNKVKLDDTDYVNCFLDSLRKYVNNYGADPEAFLTYWDDELHKQAVPAANTEGLRIMTIHSSKGLEAKHLFIPYCSWGLESLNMGKIWVRPMLEPATGVKEPLKIPVSYTKSLTETDYAPYYEVEREAQFVDNLNLLYVALTRAADNLYVYCTLDYKRILATESPSTVAEVIYATLCQEVLSSGMTFANELEQKWQQCEPDTSVWAQYTMGAQPYIKQKATDAPQTNEQTTPFDYRYGDNDILAYDYHVATDNISFKQSQESMMYAHSDDETFEKAKARINAGVLRHQILSEIRTTADVDKVVEKYYNNGIIETPSEASAIKDELNDAWSKWSEMADWFSGSWKVLRETTLLSPHDSDEAGEHRPDRVMIQGHRAVVLDYKFGKHHHTKYSNQVEGYVKILKDMGYSDVKGYLWYGFDNDLVEVV